MSRYPVFIEYGDRSPEQQQIEEADRAPAEVNIGRGDICSTDKVAGADNEKPPSDQP